MMAVEVSDPEPTAATSTRPLVWIAAIIVLAWLIAAVTLLKVFSEWETRGQFGDMFGAINALFSGLAFAGVIFTVHLQRQELGLQRKELQLTRDELRRSAAAQEASERALTKQAHSLQMAATLNALSSVIQHFELKLQNIPPGGKRDEARMRRIAYLDQLESILSGLAEDIEQPEGRCRVQKHPASGKSFDT